MCYEWLLPDTNKIDTSVHVMLNVGVEGPPMKLALDSRCGHDGLPLGHARCNPALKLQSQKVTFSF